MKATLFFYALIVALALLLSLSGTRPLITAAQAVTETIAAVMLQTAPTK